MSFVNIPYEGATRCNRVLVAHNKASPKGKIPTNIPSQAKPDAIGKDSLVLPHGSPVFYSLNHLCDPVDCSPPISSAHGILQVKNTGAGCHFLLQGIFLTQGSNEHLSTALAGRFFTAEPQGKPIITSMLMSDSVTPWAVDFVANVDILPMGWW